MTRKYYQKQLISILFCSLSICSVPILSYAFPAVNQIQAHANQVVTNLYQQPVRQPLSFRIGYIAQQFLNKPYELGALGEGPNAEFDQYPLYRVDAFDCETYVDTVLALALGHDLNSFKDYMQKIRYHQGHVNFIERNHFISMDWNPNNQAQGFIQDITRTIYPEASIAKALINKPSWYQHVAQTRVRLANASKKQVQQRVRKLVQLGITTFVPQYASIPYIPWSALFDDNNQPNQALFDRIPQGSILEIVRPNWDLTKVIGTHLNVSHLGFVLRENNTLYFLQASSLAKEVTKTPLIEYLYEAKKSPTIRGINIQMVKSTSK